MGEKESQEKKKRVKVIFAPSGSSATKTPNEQPQHRGPGTYALVLAP